VQSNLGRGTKGLLYLTVSDTVYNTLSATPFNPPTNPSATPNTANETSATEVTRVFKEHKQKVKLYEE